MTKLTNKKYKVGIKEAPKKKEYKGMNTGRGYIGLEKTEKKPWNIKDKILTRIKKYYDAVRFNR